MHPRASPHRQHASAYQDSQPPGCHILVARMHLNPLLPVHLKFLLGFSNRPCLYNWFVRHHREENPSRKMPVSQHRTQAASSRPFLPGLLPLLRDRAPLLCPERKSPTQALIILSKLFPRGLLVLVGRNYNRKAGGERSQRVGHDWATELN